MPKKIALSKIKSIALDKLHLLLASVMLVSLYLNISMYVATRNLQREIEVITTPETSSSTEITGPGTSIDPQGITAFTVRSGDTMYKILNDAGIASGDANSILSAINSVYHASQLQVGQKVVIDFRNATDVPAPDGNGHHAPTTEATAEKSDEPSQYYSKVKQLNLLSDEKNIQVVYDQDKAAYVATLTTIPISEHQEVLAGHIQESLYGDAIKAGASPSIILELINKFSYDVDFQRDIHENDAFTVYYNYYTNDDGKKIRDGNLMYGALTLSGKKFEIFRYKYGDITDYFDRAGNSIRKTLLKTPINGAKITSGYGKRVHPILGFSRMHKGLDYGAPRGTPVLAAGDGIVEFVKYSKNGYGKHIKLRHTQKYGTLYGHLDRFGKGMIKGARVSQGDIIGYVGSTGLASGPHLHYEVHANGVQVNPSKISFAKHPALYGDTLKRFKDWVGEVDQKLAHNTTTTSTTPVLLSN